MPSIATGKDDGEGEVCSSFTVARAGEELRWHQEDSEAVGTGWDSQPAPNPGEKLEMSRR